MSPKDQGESLFFDFGDSTEVQGSVLDGTGQHSAAFGSTGQHSAAFGSTGQHSAAFGSIGQHSAAFGSTGQPTVARIPRPVQRDLVTPDTFFDIDPPKRKNAGYRVRRDLRQEQLIEMPLAITGVELRKGVAEDDRAWNRKFTSTREEITKEINYLRLVVGDCLKIELTWQQPIGWPICALRTPDGRRLIETDSAELARYGVRSATLLWKSIVEKQKQLQGMARQYEALVRWMGKLPDKVGEAMDGPRSCRLLLDPEIHKQINGLAWPKYQRDTAGGPFSPLPYSVYESMRVRLWANAKAVKQHVHAMNLNYNRITNEKRVNLGKTRPAAMAIGIVDGPARTPQHYWALWVRKGSENLFYRTVTPRVANRDVGKYITNETFPVADGDNRLRTEAIDRCHLTHMKEIYRAADHALHSLAGIALKTSELIVNTMGKRFGSESPAASGRGQWRGSGTLFRWFPGQ